MLLHAWRLALKEMLDGQVRPGCPHRPLQGPGLLGNEGPPRARPLPRRHRDAGLHLRQGPPQGSHRRVWLREDQPGLIQPWVEPVDELEVLQKSRGWVSWPLR